MTDVLPVAGGVLLLLLVVRDVFHMLFHPSGQGGLTMQVFRLMWAVTGRTGQGRMLSGPLSMAAVIALWAGLMVIGWALIYLPALPDHFILATPLEPGDADGFLDALYYAWVTQSTLGYGDIAPKAAIYRVLAPLQATLGFGLFTLVVTWVLSVYPALRRQRAAASFLHALRRADERRGGQPRDVHPATLARRLERMSQMAHELRGDFTQYPSTFYFAAPDATLSLATALPYALATARGESYAEETLPAAAELEAAMELLAATLGEQHLDMAGAGTDEVLRAFRRHHGVAD